MGLKVWLPLDADLRNLGSSDITITNNGATVNTSGKIGSCYAFNGSTGYIALSGNDIFNIFTGGAQQFSITMWVFHADATRAILFGDYGTTGGINFNMELSTGHAVRFYWNGTPDTYPSNATIAASTWSHIALTYDGTKIQSYVNGIAKGSWTGTLAAKNKTSGEFRLGRDTRSDSTAFNGRMNDFRLYDHCLSAAEVKEISQGLVLHYKLNTCYLKSGTNLVTNVTAGGQTTKLTDGRLGVITSGTNADTYFTINLSESIVNGTKYHFSCNASGISEGQFWNFPLGAQGNGALPCKIYNGHNEYIFTANDINWGTNRLFMDDVSRTDWAHPATFYNFVLTKDATYEIKDSSGYNHNGTIIGNPYIVANSAHYQNAMYFVDRPCAINSVSTFSHLNTFTYSCWFKRSTNEGAFLIMGYQYGNNSSGSLSIVSDKPGFHYYAHANGNGDAQVGITQTCNDNQWHHLAATYDGTKVVSYFDGVKTAEQNITLLTTTRTFSINYTNTGSSNRDYQGALSDARVYCTALDADAIRQLYEIGAKIDNKKNWHTFEFIEENTEKVTKQGLTKGHNIIEPYLPLYDKTIYTEPDGSTWIRIFHHNNPTGSKFNSPETDWLLGKYLDANRWYDVDQAICNSLSPYEFMLKQKTTSSATETKYRWRQTANPLTAVWNDVKPGTPTFITTTGYSNSSMGGLYIFKTSQLHMSIANSTSSNWYGGIGCAAAYNGGIPGYPNTTVTDGYIDLYMRIYDNAKFIQGIGINAHNLIEF